MSGFLGGLALAAAAAPATGSAPVITAPAAVLVDVSSGQTLYAREGDRRFMPASLTKVMTAYVAFGLIQSGKLDPQRRVPVSDAAFRQWARVGSTMFLDRGQTPTVDQLLTGIMTVSANDACIVLAEGIAGSVPAFTAMMNRTARELGMRNSHFNTPNGWIDQGQTYTSARDLAILGEAMVTRYPALYAHYVGHQAMTYDGIAQDTHNPLLGNYRGADGIKTGFTNQAGYGLLGAANRDGRRLIVVIAGADLPRQRANEASALLDWGYNGWTAEKLAPAGHVLASARVQGGVQTSVPLIAGTTLYTAMPRGTMQGYTLAVRYTSPLRAPLKAGDRVGTLVVHRPAAPDAVLPLVAGQTVPEGGFWARLHDGLLTLVGQ